MSFRKRNAIITAAPPHHLSQQSSSARLLAAGLRASPLDGRLTTSTGTASLDGLFAGHTGLPLGTSLLIEEQGTTDFSGIALRYYAAEGLVQGHHVHVLGYPDTWKYELPALSGVSTKSKGTDVNLVVNEDKMRIAWRYEALSSSTNPGLASRDAAQPVHTFCHSFDLSKRLASNSIKGVMHSTVSVGSASMSLDTSLPPVSLFSDFITSLQTRLVRSASSEVHRVIVPNLLSPTLFTPGCSRPDEVLRFLHCLRALLRLHSSQLTALIALPSTLFPRNTGLTKWMELMCDGVIELIPLPSEHTVIPLGTDGSGTGVDTRNQGLLRVHSLPVYHEKGGGGAESNHFREELGFSLSASKGLVIKPFSLPPLEDEPVERKESTSKRENDMEF